MEKILLTSDVCIQENVNIDKNLKRIIGEEVDFSICNLEGYLTKEEKNLQNSLGISFKNFKSFAKETKIKAVSLANNHINDGGVSSREETIKILNNMNIEYFGTKEKPYLKIELSNKKNIIIFAGLWRLVGSNLKGLNIFWFQIKSIYREIKKYSSKDNFIVWFPHWGIDLELLPHPWQVKIAKKIIEAGADVVYGHHSHIIQPLLIYQNKPIIFCGGNFLMPFNEITYYYPKNAFNGLSLLVDMEDGTIETIRTFYNKGNKILYFLERKNFKQEKSILDEDEKKYLEYFSKHYCKRLLPVYGYNIILNYIKSIYSLAVIKAFSFKNIVRIWKNIKGYKA